MRARSAALLTALLTTLLASQSSLASCPDYLNHSLRELHSKDMVNLCEAHPGQPMLIVNTASHCGFTPQFKGLEQVYQTYRDQGLVVVGFASDDFRQEDNDEAKSAAICYKNYGVTFTMFAPTHVKGDEANPVFARLGAETKAPNWNFNKYLIDKDGKVVKRFDSSTKPESSELKQAIEAVL
jgi:glutathione peroxidase